MNRSAFVYGTKIYTTKLGLPKQALFFAIGVFLFITLIMGPHAPVAFFIPLSLFTLIPLSITYLSPTKLTLYVNDTLITKKKEFLFRNEQFEEIPLSKLKDLHYLIQSNKETGKYYALSYTDERGFSTQILPGVRESKIQDIHKNLSAHIPGMSPESTLPNRYISPKQLLQQYGWFIPAILLFPLVGALGMATFDSPAEREEALPIVLSASQQELIRAELSDQCGEKPYCIVGFFATWCSTSKRTLPIISSLSSYFRDSEEVGVASFVRDSSWGQPGAEQDKWQRDIQRTLRLGFSVPGFAVVKNGEVITSKYTGGINTNMSGDATVEAFLGDKFLNAPYLLE